jgi:hypothetical protein
MLNGLLSQCTRGKLHDALNTDFQPLHELLHCHFIGDDCVGYFLELRTSHG